MSKKQTKLVPGSWSSHMEHIASGDIVSVTFGTNHFIPRHRHPSVITWLPGESNHPAWQLDFEQLATVLRYAYKRRKLIFKTPPNPLRR